MMTEKSLDPSSLKAILDRLSQPGSLQYDDFLQSWVVQDCLAAIPEARTWPAEYLIGQALERQLRHWSDTFRLDAAYHKAWMEIFCLMAAYFRHQPGLPAYLKRPTLAQLGRTFADLEELSRLVPGHEHEADQLLNALDLHDFWLAFVPKKDEAYGTSMMDQLLRRAIANFAAWLDTRTQVKTATPAMLSLAQAEHIESAPPPNVLKLYREHVFPPSLSVVPDEWQRLLETLNTHGTIMLRGHAGTGKTHLLYGVGAHIHQAGHVPLYVYLPEYAPFSRDLDLLGYAAFHGSFGQRFRDNELRAAFERDLAQADERGHLVILADGADDLFDQEVAAVAARLEAFERLVVAERTARLPLSHRHATTVSMPQLSAESLLNLAPVGSSQVPDSFIAELQREGLCDNLELLVNAVRPCDGTTKHIAVHLVDWVVQRLQRARPSGGIVDEQRKAERLLHQLAYLRLAKVDQAEAPRRFTREHMRHAFWSMFVKLPPEDELWLLVARCERAGLLEPQPPHWEFPYAALLKVCCVEQLIENQDHWISWGLSAQPFIHWRAALIAHRGQPDEAQHFFERLLAALLSWSPLSWLEVADVLTLFPNHADPSVANMRATVQQQLNVLAQLDSSTLRAAVHERTQRLRMDLGLTELAAEPAQPLVMRDLNRDAQDLTGLLRLLRIPLPRGGEAQWLADPRVQSGLLKAICKPSSAELKWRCAAWLRRSSLSRTIHVDWLPPRRVPAWEVLAQIASDLQQDQLTRAVAQSALMRDDLILRLWCCGNTYQTLVYELLLVTGKRLHRIYNTHQWELVE